MPLVPGFEHDVFVSYCHLDDEPLREGQKGWVTALVAALNREMRQRLGKGSFDIWIDPRLAGNKPLTREIVSQLRSAATLLVVLSPSYTASEWCKRERNAFLELAKDCLDAGRIFIVRYREPKPDEIPKEFGELVGYKFWAEDPMTRIQRPLGTLDRPENEYYDQLLRLADALGKTLDSLMEHGASRGAPAPDASAPTVFVARSTDDLGDREEELKGYLEQYGLGVLPRRWYPQGDTSAFQAAMEADVRQCKVFAQLLSGNPGRKVEAGGDQRYPVLQHEVAARLGGTALQWRAPDLDLEEVRDPQHRTLLDGARACGFEEFKRVVVEEARRQVPPERKVSTTVMAFVDADAQDLQLAEEVGAFLAGQGVDCFLPVLAGPADQVRRDLERNLQECDGLLLVYGSSEPLWVRDQMLQIRKIISQRQRPLAALALFVGPPPQKGSLGFKLPNLITLDCRDGVYPGTLKQFVAALHRTTVAQ